MSYSTVALLVTDCSHPVTQVLIRLESHNSENMENITNPNNTPADLDRLVILLHDEPFNRCFVVCLLMIFFYFLCVAKSRYPRLVRLSPMTFSLWGIFQDRTCWFRPFESIAVNEQQKDLPKLKWSFEHRAPPCSFVTLSSLIFCGRFPMSCAVILSVETCLWDGYVVDIVVRCACVRGRVVSLPMDVYRASWKVCYTTLRSTASELG